MTFPTEEHELVTLVDAAGRGGATLIPFGGGGTVAGCLEAFPAHPRPVVSVNMHRMNRLLDLDAVSGLARVQAGILGPDLITALGARGFSLGHFPESCLHSTLGGWVSARSSGLTSDG